MALVTESWLVDLLLLVLTLASLLYWQYTNMVSHFKQQGIPYLQPVPVLGRFEGFYMSQQDVGLFLYNSFKNERFYGSFLSSAPAVIIKDPDLINRVLIKDFAHFHDRGFVQPEHDVLSKNLFNTSGQTWRILRQKLIPTFTTGKLRQMLDQLSKCADNLTEDIQKDAVAGEAVDARSRFIDFTTEVIGSVAFGLNFSRNNPQTIEFLSNITKFFNNTIRQTVMVFFLTLAPKLLEKLKVTSAPRHITDYFVNLTTATITYRKENNVKRNDYLNLLLTLQEAERNNKNFATTSVAMDFSEEDKLINQMDYVAPYSETEVQSKMFSDECITAQSFVFLVAGTESVATTLSFALYHIAKDPVIQQRVKQEVDQALAKHGGWSYQAVKDMAYIDQVIQEVQRMYPIVPMIMRQCTIPYTIPGSTFVVPKGMMAIIPIAGLQRDPKYYDSPEVFNPDRFIDNNHKPNAAFMPFGDGPRICIAMRFANLEMKMCVAKIVAQYTVEINKKTIEPLTFDKSFIPRPVGGIWLSFKKHQHTVI